MNLVIDDAVEVKQVTKTNPEEKRRSLGMALYFQGKKSFNLANTQQGKYC